MGLAILIVTLGPVLSLVLLVVRIHSDDVFLVCLYSYLRSCESCIPLEDCGINCCERCTVWVLWFGPWCDLLKRGVLRLADKLLRVSIIFIRASVLMTACFATAAAQIVLQSVCEKSLAEDWYSGTSSVRAEINK